MKRLLIISVLCFAGFSIQAREEDVNAILQVSDSVQYTLPSGARTIQFVMDASFIGQINGITFLAGVGDRYRNFEALPGNTLSSITYRCDAGTLRIITTK